MIWESSDWKEPLLESASILQKLSKSNEIDESEFVQIEKDVFIGFYAIRKPGRDREITVSEMM